MARGFAAAQDVQLVQALGSNTQLVSIASGQPYSGNIHTPSNQRAVGRGLAIDTPAAWTAADIAFETSQDGTTWRLAYKPDSDELILITNIPDGTAITKVAPAEVWPLLAYPYLRLVSVNTSTGAPVNQGGKRDLWLVFAS